jgi:putative SOS response-associated peptidase YedK
MCGRFSLTVDPADLQQAFPWVQMPAGASFGPRYNIAPTQPVAVVANDGKNKLDFFVWGLIPSWAKDPEIGSRMINARAETLAEKPSFRNAYRRRRCLILADGFYEWKQSPEGKSKTPMRIQLLSGQPFALAGLWELWNAADGSQVYSCTIITTEPNSLMSTIHNRMPVILPPEAYAPWLEPAEQRPEALQGWLRPYDAALMKAYPVSRLVNSPANDVPACIQPAA